MTTFRLNFPTGSQVIGSLSNGVATIPFSIASYGNPSGPSPEPTASFQIARIDPVPNDQLVVPVTLGFAPVNILGFEGFDGELIVEPPGDTNVYDPTALEVFWFWSYDEPVYTPRTPEVKPAHMRDLNKGFSKTDWHNFHAAGARTVNLYGYDTQGNWGSATYVFGPDGQAPAFVGPDDYFAPEDTAYFSPDGIFPSGLPAGTSTFTAQNPLTSWTQARETASGFVRIRFRRGETYTGAFGVGRNCYMDNYGDPADPPPNHLGVLDGAGRIIEQDFIGGYDASTETGPRQEIFLSNSSRNAGYLMLHRCKLSGGDSLVITLTAGTRTRVLSDVEITNWQNYGIFGVAENLALLGCDIHQPEDALSGNDHVGGSQTFARLTNAHGPARAGALRNLHVACTSLFSRNGWSPFSGGGAGNWNTNGSTTCQAAWRLMIEPRTNRNYTNFDRVIFEGGAEGLNLTRAVPPGQTLNMSNSIANVLVQNCLFISSRHTQSPFINASIGTSEVGPGARFGNNSFLVTEAGVAPNSVPRLGSLVFWWHQGEVDPPNPSKVFFHNNTGWIRANNAALQGATTRVLADIGALHSRVIENNVFYGPSLSPTIGTGLEPFDTPTIATYQTRFRGERFNFPPVNHPRLGTQVNIESVREGSPGPVEPNEWIEVPYPNYSGFCGGVLGQVTRNMCESALPAPWSGVRFHQFAIHAEYAAPNNIKPWSPSAAGGDGRVAFAFTDTHIRVQNLSTATLTGPFWILLDLREHLMDFVPGTGNPTTIQWLVPGTASDARLVAPSGLFARVDARGVVREAAVQGAFEAAPA